MSTPTLGGYITHEEFTDAAWPWQYLLAKVCFVATDNGVEPIGTLTGRTGYHATTSEPLHVWLLTLDES